MRKYLTSHESYGAERRTYIWPNYGATKGNSFRAGEGFVGLGKGVYLNWAQLYRESASAKEILDRLALIFELVLTIPLYP